MTNSLMLHPNDDVAVVIKAISKGDGVTYVTDGREVTMTAVDDIPIYHKVAIRSVRRGGNVLKYGEVIGYATADIGTGNHVHTQNLSDLGMRAGEDI